MGMTLNESKLKWMQLATDEELRKARESLMAHELVAVKLVREPTGEAARKTLRHHFAKDRLDAVRRRRKPVIRSRRGGRFWRHRRVGSSLPNVEVGKTYLLPRDFNLLDSLRSVRRFVAVAAVPAQKAR